MRCASIKRRVREIVERSGGATCSSDPECGYSASQPHATQLLAVQASKSRSATAGSATGRRFDGRSRRIDRRARPSANHRTRPCDTGSTARRTDARRSRRVLVGNKLTPGVRGALTEPGRSGRRRSTAACSFTRMPMRAPWLTNARPAATEAVDLLIQPGCT